MRIKKTTAVGIAFIVCIATGFILVEILLESVHKYGLAGYINLLVFLASLIYIAMDLRRYRFGKKIIDEAVEEVAMEYENKLNPAELENFKVELRDRLKDKLDNDEYKPWR